MMMRTEHGVGTHLLLLLHRKLLLERVGADFLDEKCVLTMRGRATTQYFCFILGIEAQLAELDLLYFGR